MQELCNYDKFCSSTVFSSEHRWAHVPAFPVGDIFPELWAIRGVWSSIDSTKQRQGKFSQIMQDPSYFGLMKCSCWNYKGWMWIKVFTHVEFIGLHVFWLNYILLPWQHNFDKYQPNDLIISEISFALKQIPDKYYVIVKWWQSSESNRLVPLLQVPRLVKVTQADSPYFTVNLTAFHYYRFPGWWRWPRRTRHTSLSSVHTTWATKWDPVCPPHSNCSSDQRKRR